MDIPSTGTGPAAGVLSVTPGMWHPALSGYRVRTMLAPVSGRHPQRTGVTRRGTTFKQEDGCER